MTTQPLSAPQRPRPAPLALGSLRTVPALMLREMSTTYGRSAFGYLWAVLEPAAGIVLLTLAFSFAFRSPPIGTNFPIFYASGMLPFLMYLHVSQKVATAIRFSKPLLFYPRVTFADALLARFLLNALTQVAVFMIVLTSIIVIFNLNMIIDPVAVILGIGMALMLAVGIGTLNCFLMSMFPGWERLWGILTRPLFIISCIFFLFEVVPQPLQDYLWFNPLVHVVGQVRTGIYPTYSGDYISPLYVMSVSLICLFFGLLLLRRYSRQIVND
ncbi:ABC transporter permease [Aestuariibius sp. 2305UL40-4]|uniref:ABC transporter permease n=1 Tax=Aestuariibius violaceus TaxID=3234132 RepID=UPI00345E4D18